MVLNLFRIKKIKSEQRLEMNPVRRAAEIGGDGFDFLQLYKLGFSWGSLIWTLEIYKGKR